MSIVRQWIVTNSMRKESNSAVHAKQPSKYGKTDRSDT